MVPADGWYSEILVGAQARGAGTDLHPGGAKGITAAEVPVGTGPVELNRMATAYLLSVASVYPSDKAFMCRSADRRGTSMRCAR